MIDLDTFARELDDCTDEQALEKINNELKMQGDYPDAMLLVMKADVLCHLYCNFGSGYDDYEEVTKLLSDLLENPTVAHSAAFLLERQIGVYSYAQEYASALDAARSFMATTDDQTAAAYYMAMCIRQVSLMGETDELDSALEYIDKYLDNNGEKVRGNAMKIEILAGLKRHDEAFALLDFCQDAYTNDLFLWLNLRFHMYNDISDLDGGIEYYLKMLANATDDENRDIAISYLLALASIKYKDSQPKMVEFCNDLIAQCPDVSMLYMEKSEHLPSEKVREKIALVEKADSIDPDSYNHDLLRLYIETEDQSLRDKYFAVMKNEMRQKQYTTSLAWNTIYGCFHQYDSGESKKIVEEYLDNYPDDECAHSLLGKIYEIGVGVPVDLKRAFDIHLNTFENIKKGCGCGALFTAWHYYYGKGTPKDTKKAADIILDILDKRYEHDRICLYAIMAFETDDARFDKQKALDMLEENADAVCLLLLYKYAGGNNSTYLTRFKKKYSSLSFLEREQLKPYIDNPDMPYEHMVTN